MNDPDGDSYEASCRYAAVKAEEEVSGLKDRIATLEQMLSEQKERIDNVIASVNNMFGKLGVE